MARLSTGMKIVIGLAVLVVLAAGGGVGAVVYLANRAATARQEAMVKAAAELQKAAAEVKAAALREQAEAKKLSDRKAAELRKAREAEAKRQAAAAGQAAVAAAEGQGGGEMTTTRLEGEGGAEATVQSSGGPAQIQMTVNGQPVRMMGGPGGVPAQRRVRQLNLSAEQSAAIDDFDRGFLTAVDVKRQEGAQAIEAAFGAMRAARESGDQAAIEAAQQQVRDAFSSQMEAMKELNEQYYNGVSPLLTTEQADELKKSLSENTGAMGYMHRDGGTRSTYTIIEPKAVPVTPPNDAPPPP